MLIEPNQPLLPQSFRTRKSQILANLSQTIPPQPPSGPVPSVPLPDKSPKGSVDSQITTLITEINGYEGLVTTSSCAGRVSVYVEGRGTAGAVFTTDGDGDGETRLKATATVGGKGGGRWAYVSHDPIGSGIVNEDDYYYTKLFGLNPSKSDETFSRITTDASLTTSRRNSKPRLVRLSFEPFILHVMCASLSHAKPLLAAAVSSGFRESGVQSLKNLTDGEACPMVAVRSAGLGFGSVVGIVVDDGDVDETSASNQESKDDRCRAIVGEDVLALFVNVINERFVENERRRDLFMHELRRAMTNEKTVDWEDQAMRRQRKKEEGMKVQMEQQKQKCTNSATKKPSNDLDTLGDDALVLMTD